MRDLTTEQITAAAASLRTVGGVYDYVAAAVENQNTEPTQ